MKPSCDTCGRVDRLVYLIAGAWACFRCRRDIIEQEQAA